MSLAYGRGGYQIVLTADRTLMSEYGGDIFMGFSACAPEGLAPDWVYFNFSCPPIRAGPNGEEPSGPLSGSLRALRTSRWGMSLG